MDWKLIDTAPHDGTPVLLWLESPLMGNDVESYVPWREVQAVIGWWNDNGWSISFMEDGSADTEGFSSHFYMGFCYPLPSQPTHWMPLPAAPV